MILTTTEVILCVVIAMLIGLFAAYLFWAQRRFGELEERAKSNTNKGSLELAAYERLTLLTERLRLNSLAGRLTQSGMSARELQQAMLAALRNELEHNVTQQLYVKKEVWEAILKMKEQNSFILNQIAATLPEEATALDLSRKVVQFVLDNPGATLNNLVLDALRHEVNQLA